MNKTQRKWINACNSKMLRETMVTLGALKEGSEALQEMELNEIQVHLLDKDGDGVILCLEYDEQTGELNKTFSSVEEYYEDCDDELESDTEDTALFDEEYYGGRTDFTVTILDEEGEEFEDEFLKYDLHKVDKPLLN